MSLALSPQYLLGAADGGEAAGHLGVRTDQAAVTVLVVFRLVLEVEELTTIRTGGTLSDPGLQAGFEVTGGNVRLTVRQRADEATVRTLHTELEDLSVSEGVRKDVGEGDVGVVVRTGLAFSEPGHQAGPTEPVAAHRLLGVSLAQQTDGTLVLTGIINKGVLVTSLVVMLRVIILLARHCDGDVMFCYDSHY